MKHHLAQINIARFRLPVEHPVNADFIANLDRVNALAEAQPGFVWRLIGDGNNALDVKAYQDPNIAVNMSVWTGLEALANFVYRNPGHLEIMQRRREWFDKMDVSLALWWIPAGTSRRSRKVSRGSKGSLASGLRRRHFSSSFHSRHLIQRRSHRYSTSVSDRRVPPQPKKRRFAIRAARSRCP